MMTALSHNSIVTGCLRQFVFVYLQTTFSQTSLSLYFTGTVSHVQCQRLRRDYLSVHLIEKEK